MNAEKEIIDIILPWRIGDAVLNIPMLVCLKQLNEKAGSKFRFRIVTMPFLFELFSSLNIFECRKLNLLTKMKSSIMPSSQAFFVETTRKHFGYKSKKAFGLTNPSKKIVKYSKEMLFLDLDNIQNVLPSELISFLRDKYSLPLYSISLFGVCLELGYSVEQIMDAFDFTPDSFSITKFSLKNLVSAEKYMVFCMEAAYGKKGEAFRRCDEQYYFEIADKCYSDYGIKSVFVGIDKAIDIPSESHFIDMRRKLNLFELACVLRSSICYVGNDTGPLHIANIMQKPSIGVYFREKSLTDFSTMFPKLNTQVYNPCGSGEIIAAFNDLLEKSFV